MLSNLIFFIFHRCNVFLDVRGVEPTVLECCGLLVGLSKWGNQFFILNKTISITITTTIIGTPWSELILFLNYRLAWLDSRQIISDIYLMHRSKKLTIINNITIRCRSLKIKNRGDRTIECRFQLFDLVSCGS